MLTRSRATIWCQRGCGSSGTGLPTLGLPRALTPSHARTEAPSPSDSPGASPQNHSPIWSLEPHTRPVPPTHPAVITQGGGTEQDMEGGLRSDGGQGRDTRKGRATHPGEGRVLSHLPKRSLSQEPSWRVAEFRLTHCGTLTAAHGSTRLLPCQLWGWHSPLWSQEGPCLCEANG